MIFYAPYEARHHVVTVMRDFLKSSMPRRCKVSSAEFSMLPAHMKPISVLPFMDQFSQNIKIDRNAVSARQWLGRAIDGYGNGRHLLELTRGDEQMFYASSFTSIGTGAALTNPFHEALAKPPEVIMSRLNGRVDVICETPQASLVAIHSSWQDFQAISEVFGSAMTQHKNDFERVMKPIDRFVREQCKQASKTINGLSADRLTRDVDYTVIPL